LEKETVEAAVNEAEKSYYAGRGEIDELEKSIREVHKTREHMDTLTMELQEKLNEVRLKLNGIKERLSVEFEIDLDQLMEESPEINPDYIDQEAETLRQTISQIKEKMDRIGPINPLAMEAYDEIKERH